MAAQRFPAQSWLGLGVLCLAAMVNLLQSASLSPLLPLIGREFGTSDAITGQLATVGSVVGFAFSLAATPWMDRWSRRTWLRLEASLVVIGLLLVVFAPAFTWLAIGRVIAACGAALIMANCMAGARELIPDAHRRNRAIGLIVSAATLVLVVGLPVITQLAARLGWRAAMASILLPTVLLLIGAGVLPPGQHHDPRVGHGRLTAAFRAILTDKRVTSFLVAIGLLSALYSGWFVYFGAYTTKVFTITPALLGLLFSAGGVSQLVANNLAPLLARRYYPLRILNVAMVAVAAALMLTGIAIVSIPGALIAAIVILNGTGMAYIATNVLLLDSDLPHPGAVMSLSAATGSLGAALGPFLTGLALATSGSFEAAYRTLGLLAPLCLATIWLGTRSRPAATIAEQIP